jgi:hypothetical protein
MNPDLLRTALVGTARAGALAPLDPTHPAEALLAGWPAGDPESVLLLRAGVQAVFAAAGHLPADGVPPLPEAPAETARRPAERLGALLQTALTLDAWGLFGGLLDELAARHLHLPHELLPDVLELSDSRLREQLRPVLGERGRWLARLNPQWSWVEAAAPLDADHSNLERLHQLFQEGELPQRCQALAAWRRVAPAAAREAVATTLPRENAETRGRLVSELATGLSIDDEAFLESCLDDRSAVVKRIAAQLLSRLPTSALAARLRARGQGMLTAGKKGLVFKALTLACAPPESIDKSWERDGIPQKPTGGRGQRAAWTEAVFELIPPSHWESLLGAPPEALIEALQDDPFGPSVVVGWTRACCRFAGDDPPSARWAPALWNYWSTALDQTKEQERGPVVEPLQALLAVLEPAERETSVLELLWQRQGAGDVSLLELLGALPARWSVPGARRFLDLTRSVIRKSPDNFVFHWCSRLPLAARAMPPELFAACLDPWDLTADTSRTTWVVSSLERELDKFQEVIRLRQSFFEAVSASVC